MFDDFTVEEPWRDIGINDTLFDPLDDKYTSNMSNISRQVEGAARFHSGVVLDELVEKNRSLKAIRNNIWKFMQMCLGDGGLAINYFGLFAFYDYPEYDLIRMPIVLPSLPLIAA